MHTMLAHAHACLREGGRVATTCKVCPKESHKGEDVGARPSPGTGAGAENRVEAEEEEEDMAASTEVAAGTRVCFALSVSLCS